MSSAVLESTTVFTLRVCPSPRIPECRRPVTRRVPARASHMRSRGCVRVKLVRIATGAPLTATLTLKAFIAIAPNSKELTWTWLRAMFPGSFCRKLGLDANFMFYCFKSLKVLTGRAVGQTRRVRDISQRALKLHISFKTNMQAEVFFVLRQFIDGQVDAALLTWRKKLF